MQGTSSAAYTFFLPILILIVIQLAKVAQEANVQESVSDEHPPLLISPVVGIIFSIFRWMVVGIAGAIILKLLSDSLEARIQAWYYERLKSVLGPVHEAQIGLIERISGEQVNDDAEVIQLLLQLKSIGPKVLPSPLFLVLPSEPNPEVPYGQIESVSEYRVRAIDYIYALESRLIPDLGRFMFIHTANSILLLLGLLFSSTLLSGSFRQISVIITVLVWFILPVFELDEYDMMLSEDIVVYSFPVHVLNVIILAVAVLGIGQSYRIQIPIINNILEIPYGGWLAYLFAGFLFVFGLWIFASTLERELRRVTPESADV